MEGRSSYEWRNPRGAVTRGLEKLEDTPFNVLHGRGLVTDSAKRKLYEQGTVGRAEILERPPDRTMVGGQAQGVFRFIVHLPGRELYTEDEFFLLVLELRAAGESPWSVRFGQRVPRGAESLVAPGRELQVAFSAVGEDEAVAVDWPATSGGLYS